MNFFLRILFSSKYFLISFGKIFFSFTHGLEMSCLISKCLENFLFFVINL